MTLFGKEAFSTVVVIFTTGPIKVFLDVKRGKTSISEMKDNYEDQRGWFHKQMGVDERPSLFPDSMRQGQNLRRRNVDPQGNNPNE